MKFKPRDYQETMHSQNLRALSKNENVVNVLPCRGGKSWNICALAEIGYLHNRPVLILAHTDLLLFQISNDLLENGIPHGFIKSGHYESRDAVQVASRDTIVKRLHKYSHDDFRLILGDEFHLARCSTYEKILGHFTGAKLIGFTATLSRGDGLGFRHLFTGGIVRGPNKLELIKRKVIVPTVVASPEGERLKGLKTIGGDFSGKSMEKALTEKYIHGEYVQHYFDFANGLDGIAFCPTINFAKEVADNFNKNGVPAVDISSRDGKNGVKQKLSDYYAGKYKILTSCQIFIMGVHLKKAMFTLGLRDTTSEIIFYQMLGRGIMPAEGKDKHIWIDATNTLMTMGFPDFEPEWSLDGETKEEKKKRMEDNADRIVRCDFCKWPHLVDEYTSFNPNSRYFMQNPNEKQRWSNKFDAVFCPHCGAPKETHGKQLKTINGKLELISAEDYERYIAEQKWLIEEKWLEEQRIAEQKRIKKKRMKEARTLDDMLVLEKEYRHEKGWAAKQLHFRRYAAAKYSAPRF